MAYDFPLSLMIRGKRRKITYSERKSDNIVKIKENMTRNKEINVMKTGEGKITLIFQKFAGIMKT